MKWNIFKKKPPVVTLKRFAEAVKKVATERGEDYYNVKVQLSSHDPEIIILTGYINGTNHLDGKTIEEVCDKLRASGTYLPEKPKTADIII